MWRTGTAPNPELPEVQLIRPEVNSDARGTHYNFEEEPLGVLIGHPYVNVSQSRFAVLRGLHVQHPFQSKIVTCLRGTIFDVAVDARPGSPTLGKHVGVYLDHSTHAMLYVPEGFLHGFYVVEGDHATVAYYVNKPYNPEKQFSVKWADHKLDIQWPLRTTVELSHRDRHLAMNFEEYLKLLEKPS